jgi:hypothetical protein
MKSSTAGRRRGGAGGPRGGGGRGYRGSGRGGYRRYNSNGEDAHSTPNGEFHDFPADFTTLPSMYPVTPEFIMPYVSAPQAFYPVTFVPPPASAVVDDAQLNAAFVPVDEAVVVDMVRKQV